jgi:hypothetical protein
MDDTLRQAPPEAQAHDREDLLELRRDLDALLTRVRARYRPAADRMAPCSAAAADLRDCLDQTRLVRSGATLYGVSLALSRVLEG